MFCVLDPVYIFSLQLSSMGAMWYLSMHIPTGEREGTLLDISPPALSLLHHVSFHLIKFLFQGHHMHSKIGRKRENMSE